LFVVGIVVAEQFAVEIVVAGQAAAPQKCYVGICIGQAEASLQDVDFDLCIKSEFQNLDQMQISKKTLPT
jgi:hypothetical protein